MTNDTGDSQVTREEHLVRLVVAAEKRGAQGAAERIAELEARIAEVTRERDEAQRRAGVAVAKHWEERAKVEKLRKALLRIAREFSHYPVLVSFVNHFLRDTETGGKDG